MAKQLPPMNKRGILITGCSTGIGRHCAIRLKQRGYPVVATARKLADIVDLQEQGIHCLELDVTNDVAIQKAIDYFDEQQLCLYGLFNNAGYGQPGAVEDLTRHVIAQQFDTNVFGPTELIRAAMPLMRKQGFGRIVQNSSVLGFVAMPYRGAYNASKFAVEGLIDTLRLELHGTNIHAILIEPGPIQSQFRRTAYHQFTANTDSKHSAHHQHYQKEEERLSNTDGNTIFTQGPEAVYKRLVRALESKSPAPRYYVTLPTYVFGFLKRILPTRILDILLRQV